MSSRKKDKLQVFTQTSNEPYLRHHYKIVLTNNQTITVDNYHDVHVYWSSIPYELRSHVEVISQLG
jgi:hypothetical protein